LLGIFVPTAAIGFYHRWRAASGERISHKEEGYLFFAALRLAGICLWITTLAYLLNPALVRWAAMPLPDSLRWAGAFTGGLGVLLAFWTLTNLGKNLTDTVVVRKAATLVTHGPYRWVRHPFYVTAGLLMISVTLLAANWLIGLSGLLAMSLLVVRTDKEEQMLIERFGQEYQDYMVTTGRFIPRIGRLK
jgi:protein-S-isoprenylcysteine O-methyltransferase Ste14